MYLRPSRKQGCSEDNHKHRGHRPPGEHRFQEPLLSHPENEPHTQTAPWLLTEPLASTKLRLSLELSLKAEGRPEAVSSDVTLRDPLEESKGKHCGW